jgi:hypothetical protein
MPSKARRGQLNMSDEQKRKVDKIVDLTAEREKVSWAKARTMVHKYVCEGKCNWYRTKSEEAGFSRLDLSKKQKRQLEKTVKEVMGDLTTEQAKVRIHEVLCPGHPRPMPR